VEDHRPLCYRARFTEKMNARLRGWLERAAEFLDPLGRALWVAGAPMLGLSLIPYRLVIRAAAALPLWAAGSPSRPERSRLPASPPGKAPRHS
jgi:hypothetical protein